MVSGIKKIPKTPGIQPLPNISWTQFLLSKEYFDNSSYFRSVRRCCDSHDA